MKETLTVWIVNRSPFFCNGVKHGLRRSRFIVERTGTSFSEMLDSSVSAPSLVIFSSLAEPELESMIKQVKAQCDVTRFVLLLDEEKQTALPETLMPLLAAVLPKEMAPDALKHFLEIVSLGQPLFVRVSNHWGSGPGSLMPEICRTQPTQRELHNVSEQDAPNGVPVPFSATHVPPELTDDKGPLLQVSMSLVGDYEFELSKRQKEILQCLKQGASNKVIARQLQLAEATVKIHIRSLLKKLRLSNRTQAAIWATEMGLGAALQQPLYRPDLALTRVGFREGDPPWRQRVSP